MYQRYAVFFTPPAGQFADFGAAWLGWDSAKGALVQQPEVTGTNMDSLTKRPRSYGFHATLKAPFHLLPDQTEHDLIEAITALALKLPVQDLGPLPLSTTHGFLALRPDTMPAALLDFAARIVTELDPFRAPQSESEIARRRQSRLSPRQDQQMLEWGYPYVFNDFHFHMTLSGRLSNEQSNKIAPHLQALLKPCQPNPVILDALTLMGQDVNGMFYQLKRVACMG